MPHSSSCRAQEPDRMGCSSASKAPTKEGGLQKEKIQSRRRARCCTAGRHHRGVSHAARGKTTPQPARMLGTESGGWTTHCITQPCTGVLSKVGALPALLPKLLLAGHARGSTGIFRLQSVACRSDLQLLRWAGSGLVEGLPAHLYQPPIRRQQLRKGTAP